MFHCSGSLSAAGIGSGITSMPSSAKDCASSGVVTPRMLRAGVVMDAPRFLGEALAHILGFLQHLAQRTHYLRLQCTRIDRLGLRRARQVQARRRRQTVDLGRSAHRTFDQLAGQLRFEFIGGSEPAFEPMTVRAL
jgi:hypothetical protein